MPNFQDWSVGIGKESVFGTAVTPTRWLEFTEPKPLTIDRGIKQGAGLRPGSRVARAARRVKTIRQASGDITVEAFSKGLGLLLEACMGSGVSTVVSGAVYQQVHSLADCLPCAAGKTYCNPVTAPASPPRKTKCSTCRAVSDCFSAH